MLEGNFTKFLLVGLLFSCNRCLYHAWILDFQIAYQRDILHFFPVLPTLLLYNIIEGLWRFVKFTPGRRGSVTAIGLLLGALGVIINNILVAAYDFIWGIGPKIQALCGRRSSSYTSAWYYRQRIVAR